MAEQFSEIPEVLEELRNGKMIVLVDAEDRENEGDLIMAAEKITMANPVCSQAIMKIKKRLFQGIILVSTYQACGSPPRATTTL